MAQEFRTRWCPSPPASIACRRSRKTTLGPSRSNRSRAKPSQNESSSLLDKIGRRRWPPPKLRRDGALREECVPTRVCWRGVSSRADPRMSLKYKVNSMQDSAPGSGASPPAPDRSRMPDVRNGGQNRKRPVSNLSFRSAPQADVCVTPHGRHQRRS